MKKPDFFDREGRPIDVLKWASLFNDRAYLIVKESFTPQHEYVVVTGWSGVDRGWGDFPKPLIFDVMVFDGRKYRDKEMVRGVAPPQYASTEQEALAMHDMTFRNMVALEAFSDSASSTL